MELNRYLRWGLLIGIFSTLLIPLYVSTDMFFPFITGKNFIFRAMVELMFPAYVALAWRDAKYRLSWSWVFGMVIMFVAIMGLADIFGVNPYRSFWSNYERMEGYVTTLHLFAYFLILGAVMNGEKIWLRFWHLFIGMSVFFGYFSLLQIAHELTIDQGGGRVDASFGNATYLAVYLLFAMFITVIAWYKNSRSGQADAPSREIFYGWIGGLSVGIFWTFSKIVSNGFSGGAALPWLSVMAMIIIATVIGVTLAGTWRERTMLMHILYGAAILFQFFGLYLTATRGALLGLLAGTVAAGVMLIFFERERASIRKVGIGVLAAALVIVVGFMFVKDTSFIRDNKVLGRFAAISLTEKTTESRFLIWNMALKGWEEHPILGWGQESFPYIFAKYFDPRMYGQEPWFDRAHDVFLDWLTAGGVLGLGSYLVLFMAAVWYAWRSKEVFSALERSLLIGLLVGYFFQNLFVFDNLTSYLLYFALLAYIHARVSSVLPAPRWFARLGQAAAKAEPVGMIAIPLAVIGSALSLYFFVGEGLLQNWALLGALENYNDGGVTNLAKFKTALAYDSFGTMETREQLVQAAVTARNAQATDDTKRQFFDLATSEMSKEIEQAPLNVRAKVFLGSLYLQYGMFDQSIDWFGKAHAQSPAKQDIAFGLGQAYLEKGDADTALKIFKEAYDRYPKNDSPENVHRIAVTYAAAAIYAHRLILANQLLAENFGSAAVTDPLIINAYAATKQWPALIALLAKHIVDVPNDLSSRLTLASVYLTEGDNANAVATLQEVERVDPSTKTQMEQYIAKIKSGKIQ